MVPCSSTPDTGGRQRAFRQAIGSEDPRHVASRLAWGHNTADPSPVQDTPEGGVALVGGGGWSLTCTPGAEEAFLQR